MTHIFTNMLAEWAKKYKVAIPNGQIPDDTINEIAYEIAVFYPGITAEIEAVNKRRHIGEIWRKMGPIDWCMVESVQMPGSTDDDGGCPGVSVVYGDYNVKTNRVKWKTKRRFFVTAKTYDAFKRQMKKENYYLYEAIR